jgi:hypothetical protein
MKLFKKLAAATAVSLAMIGSASADTVLNNWVFNPNGGGFAAGQQINEYLDVSGNAFIELTGTGPGSFNFVEHAAFNLVQADGNGQLFPLNFAGGNITATFEGYGSGNFSGAISFGGGTIRMYQNPTNNQYATANGIYGANLGNLIAEFEVIPGGGGLVDGTGLPTTNGQISVFAKASAGALDAGYFFKADGTDLSGEDVLSFAFTNANAVGSPTAMQVSELACQFAGYTGPATGVGCAGGTYSNVPGNHFFVSNNGQFKLAQDVPEPGSLALFGMAILGAGLASRKRKQA